MSTDDVFSILRDYPQIYEACHIEHATRANAPQGLTSRDSSLMAHIEALGETQPKALARHLGISPSTLSPALRRLSDLGYVRIAKSPRDARRQSLTLTPEGCEVMADSSVLNKHRVKKLLDQLKKGDRRSAVRGLRLLAIGARHLRNNEA